MGRATTARVVVASVGALLLAAAGCDEGGGGAGVEVEPTPDADGAAGETLTGAFEPLEEHTDRDLAGEAVLEVTEDGTTLSVQVSGLEAGAAHPAHLHEGACAERGPHYQHDPQGVEEPPNELWPSSEEGDPTAGLQADETGEASGEATADWQPRDEPLSVFVHAAGGENPKIGCADLS